MRSPLEGAAATVGAQSFSRLATSLGRLAAGSFVERRRMIVQAKAVAI